MTDALRDLGVDIACVRRSGGDAVRVLRRAGYTHRFSTPGLACLRSPVRTLTRQELTAALAARQMLIERQRLAPAEAIRRLTPLQGQHPPAPYIALAARLDGFTRGPTSRRRSTPAAS